MQLRPRASQERGSEYQQRLRTPSIGSSSGELPIQVVYVHQSSLGVKAGSSIYAAPSCQARQTRDGNAMVTRRLGRWFHESAQLRADDLHNPTDSDYRPFVPPPLTGSEAPPFCGPSNP